MALPFEDAIDTAITLLNWPLVDVGLASLKVGAHLFLSPYLAYTFDHVADRASIAMPR